MGLRPGTFLARALAWFSTLAALLLALGGNTALSAHWLIVPHRLCQVHGTWEHSSAVAETDSHSAPESGPTYRSDSTSHDECSFATLSRPEQLIGTLAPHGAGQPPLERAQSVAPVSDRQPPIPTLVFAPKHSPPARV
jgi:hypothetical protein